MRQPTMYCRASDIAMLERMCGTSMRALGGLPLFRICEAPDSFLPGDVVGLLFEHGPGMFDLPKLTVLKREVGHLPSTRPVPPVWRCRLCGVHSSIPLHPIHFDVTPDCSTLTMEVVPSKGGPPMFGVTPGRIVHYVLGPTDLPETHRRHVGVHRPAILVEVWDKHRGTSNLVVFIDGANDGAPEGTHTRWVTSRLYGEDKAPGTWHWPEREEPMDQTGHVTSGTEPLRG